MFSPCKWCVLLLLLSAHAFVASAGEDSPPEKLIAVLENGDFDERLAAAKKLEQLGERARKALEHAAAHSESLDVRQAAERILGAMKQCRLIIEAVDAGGKPVAGAEAELSYYSYDLQAKSEQLPAKTQADGRIVVDKLTPGVHFIYITWQNLFPKPGDWNQGACFLNPGDNVFRQVLLRHGTVTGQVLASDGSPIQGAGVVLTECVNPFAGALPVSMRAHGTELQRHPPVIADEEGNFKIEDVAPGTYRLFAYGDHHEARYGGILRIGDGATLTASIKLDPKSKTCGEIRLRMLNKDGELLKNCGVHVELHPVFSAADDAAREAWFWMIRRNMQFGEETGELTTGNDGVLVLEGIDAGKWSLSVYDQNEGLRHFSGEVTVKAGEPANLGDLRAPATGQIAGRILNAAGEALNTLTVSPFRADDLNLACLLNEPDSAAEFFSSGNFYDFNSSSTDNQGRFELNNLAPGAYSLCVVRNNFCVGIIHGVQVASNDTTRLRDFKISHPLAANFRFSATLLLPDGMPAANRQFTIVYNDGIAEAETDAAGRFSYEDYDWTPPGEIVVILEGHRPERIDLLHSPIITTVRLQKQRYGDVAITVVAPDGTPIPGAAVMTSSEVHYYGGEATPARITDRKGHAALKRLSFGPRQLFVLADGYYQDKPAEIDVAQSEQSLTTTLRHGLALKGSATLPRGVSPAGVRLELAYSNDSGAAGFSGTSRFTSLDAQGRFAFEGLAPGAATLRVLGQSLILAQPGAIQIAENMPEIALKIMDSPTLQVELGSAAGGLASALMPAGTWRSYSYGQATPALELLDSDGKAEFPGTAPGAYDLVIDSYNDIPALGRQHTLASLVFRNIQATGAQSQTLKLALPEGRGSVTGRVITKDKVARLSVTSLADVVLQIAGTQAMAEVRYAYPECLHSEYLPATTGTASDKLLLRDPASFTVSRLPPGEYKLYALLDYNDGKEPSRVKLTQIPLRSFTIKNGETTVLDEIEIGIPTAEIEKLRLREAKQNSDMLRNLLNEVNGNIAPVFQP